MPRVLPRQPRLAQHSLGAEGLFSAARPRTPSRWEAVAGRRAVQKLGKELPPSFLSCTVSPWTPLEGPERSPQPQRSGGSHVPALLQLLGDTGCGGQTPGDLASGPCSQTSLQPLRGCHAASYPCPAGGAKDALLMNIIEVLSGVSFNYHLSRLFLGKGHLKRAKNTTTSSGKAPEISFARQPREPHVCPTSR